MLGLRVAFSFLVILVAGTAYGQDMANLGILTGSKTGTYFQFGNNINTIVSKVCNTPVVVKETGGAIDNLKKLRLEPFVQLALTQHDVLSFVRLYRKDDKELQEYVDRFRYVFSLYPEEIHIVVRRDSGIKSMKDLRGKRVATGASNSGTQVTSTLLFGMLDIPISPVMISPDQALDRLFVDFFDDASIDAFVSVAGKPTKLLSSNDARMQQLTLLPIDDPRVFELYKSAGFSAGDYPWLDHDVPAAAVLSALITYDFKGANCDNVSMMARQIRSNLDELQRIGHPKWNEVKLDEPIPGWEQYKCVVARSKVRTRPGEPCKFVDSTAAASVTVPAPVASPRNDPCKDLTGAEKKICEIANRQAYR
ncbi:TAXI family TRAP transporter solute-binding subunit [Rhodomicrobium sp.]|uniref:TAXI family TRAP transporter solute-binding subunit n=2 Tax=Rhodomicrobium TaxID=1068 RepID=UPI0039E2FE8D